MEPAINARPAIGDGPRATSTAARAWGCLRACTAAAMPACTDIDELKRLPVQGTGFLIDAYDLFSMTSINVVLTAELGASFDAGGRSRLNGAVFLGVIAGQLICGRWVGVAALTLLPKDFASGTSVSTPRLPRICAGPSPKGYEHLFFLPVPTITTNVCRRSYHLCVPPLLTLDRVRLPHMPLFTVLAVYSHTHTYTPHIHSSHTLKFIRRLADVWGRKTLFVVTAVFLVLGSTLCTAAPYPFAFPSRTGASWGNTLIWVLVITRFVLGIGIGGEYPLAATVSSEQSSAKNRGRQVGLVHAMQAVGQLLSALISLSLVATHARRRPYSQGGLESIWRVLFGLGTLPPAIILFWRCGMEETASFARAQARDDPPPLRILARHYGKRLVGASLCWMLSDIMFYGIGIWSASLLLEISGHGTDNLYQVMVQSVILALVSLPWQFVAACTVDRVGHKRMQFVGFCCTAAGSFLFAALYKQLAKSPAAFVFFLALLMCALNIGPNTTTFIIAGESFPSRIRATAHGFCAACGKVGALIGSSFFWAVRTASSTEVCFVILGLCAIAGALVTWLCVDELTGVSIEEEDRKYDEITVAYRQSLG